MENKDTRAIFAQTKTCRRAIEIPIVGENITWDLHSSLETRPMLKHFSGRKILQVIPGPSPSLLNSIQPTTATWAVTTRFLELFNLKKNETILSYF